MDEGEKGLRKAFEQVTTGNVKTAVEYSKETRRLMRILAEEVKRMETELNFQRVQMEQFKIQLAGVQTKLFGGGTA